MAAREHELEVYRGSQRQDRFSALLDGGNLVTAARRELHRWLEDERVDEDDWDRYTITVPGALGSREVHA